MSQQALDASAHPRPGILRSKLGGLSRIPQIERTIAVLGTIYSQLLTYRSTFHVADYQQLADNVAEEVHHLQDYLEALQEVKGSRPLL